VTIDGEGDDDDDSVIFINDLCRSKIRPTIWLATSWYFLA